ncbi:MAG: FAD:protein FMN transferase [candidate division Zixibacteria bacterium]|nr:FAD:protein FMN transferase [candidate division Zixibacteria bacterium]
MGTTIELTLAEDEYRHETVIRSFDALSEIDHLLSVHQSTSELSQVNRNPGQWRKVSPHFSRVASAAGRIGEMTDGEFDVTVLPVMRHWGFYDSGSPGRDTNRSRRSLQRILERVDFHQLQVKGGEARIASSGYSADFGGIAKGYGVDRAVRALRDHRIRCGLVSAGGDIFALGRPAPNRLWRVGIRSPNRPDALCAMVELENEAIATAGGYENYRIRQGRRIAHILNPRLGVSSDHVLSATIIAPDTMTADAFATATYVLGVENSLRLLDDMPHVEGIWIDRRGHLTCTRDIKHRVQIIG